MAAWRSLTLCYLDASIVLEALLPGGNLHARRWMDRATKAGDSLTSSTLLELEVIRTLRREGIATATTVASAVVARISLVTIDHTVLKLAGAIEPHVKSLDAIHLATCLRVGPRAVMVTHDRAMAAAAADLGLETYDPLG